MSKICDQISDAILDSLIAQDPSSRVAVECLTTTGLVVVAGEVTTKGYADIQMIVRNTLKKIGYTNPQFGIDHEDAGVLVSIHGQSPDISQGVTETQTKEQGAGDQGCLKQGTLIRTSRGFIPIEDVNPGDNVLTLDGFKKVLKSKFTGIKQIIEVVFSNGMSLECTPDHMVLCYNKNGKLCWKEAQTITKQDFICMHKPESISSNDLLSSKVERKEFFTKFNHKIYGSEETTLNQNVGYVMGELIGDGYCGKTNSLQIAFGNNLTHMRVVKSILDNTFPDQWRLVKNNGSNELKIDSVLVRRHFENFGLLYNRSPAKVTPKAIFTSPSEVIQAYLRGLFDSDGTIVSNTGRNKDNIRIKLSSSSLRLLRETQLLLYDFGIKTSIIFNRPKGTPVGKDPKYKSHHDNYVLGIVGFESYQNFARYIGFLDPKKSERMEHYIKTNKLKPANSRGFFLVPHPTKDEMTDEQRIGKILPFAVTTIGKTVSRDKAPVYDLEIEDVHMFSANGIFVHNSMFGYACNETPELMPLPIMIAHALTRKMAEVRKNGTIPCAGPDGKSQVTVEYHDGVPKRLSAVVIAQQHTEDLNEEELKEKIMEYIIKPVCGKYMDNDTKVHINATGKFVIGGPEGDSGVTGRKIIADTYGGVGRHGGGAFCVAGDSFINLEQGLAPISELSQVKQNTLIKTDISPAPLGTWVDNDIMETLTVKTKDGYKLEGTSNQCIRVIDKEGNYIWRRLNSLESTDFIAIQRKNRLFGQKSKIDFSFEHKKGTRRKNIFKFPEELTEDYAYLLGLLIGDGRCTSQDGIQLCVCEQEMKDIVQALFDRLFRNSGKIFGHWAFQCGVELRAYLHALGLENWRSWQKHVPKSVFKATKSVVAAFLRGLFDTDGSVRLTGRNGNSLEIKLTTTSKELAMEVQQLLLNFGIISNIQTVEPSGKMSEIRNRIVESKRTLYHLRIKGSMSVQIFKEEIGFGLPRKEGILHSNEISEKRNLFVVPNQRERVKRLWTKLSPREHQEDKACIGRWLRNPSTKGTKELTYSKLVEFLDAYEDKFAGDFDYEYLRTYYVLSHYYTKMKSTQKGNGHVYDFVVPGVHTFIANGFVCHNSGKDPSKVDRSGAYIARYVAKNIVAAGLADKCEILISYCIGVAQPTSINIDTFGTGKIPDEKIVELVKKHFRLTPKWIIDTLDLRRPIYQKTATYGHFGRNDPDFTWEKTDKAEELKRDAGI